MDPGSLFAIALVATIAIGAGWLAWRDDGRPAPTGGGGAVGRRPGARKPVARPAWDDPSWPILQQLEAARPADHRDPPEQPDRRWLPGDLQRLHPRFHPAYYEARVLAILARIRAALAADDLGHADDCLAGPGRDELARALKAGDPTGIADGPPLQLVPLIVRDRQADDRDTLWLELVGHDAVWHLAWQPQGWVLASVKTGADRDRALADRNVAEDLGGEGGAVGRT